MKNVLLTSLIIPMGTSIIASIVTFALSNYFLNKDKAREQRKKYFVMVDLVCHYLIRISQIFNTLDTLEKKEKFRKLFRVEYENALRSEIIDPTFKCIGKNLQSLVEYQVKRDSEITEKIKYIHRYMNKIPYKDTLQVLHGNGYESMEYDYYNFDDFINAVEFVLKKNNEYYSRK